MLENLNKSYVSKFGLKVNAKSELIKKDYKEEIIKSLNTVKGGYFCSSFEYPGRYSRWDMGFSHPIIEFKTNSNEFTISSLNNRGNLLIKYIYSILVNETYLKIIKTNEREISGIINESNIVFKEEERSRQPSVFTLIRNIREAFFSKEDKFLGFYGAFGYDLIFQFEKIKLLHKRNKTNPDMILYIPDEIFIIDHQKDISFIIKYDFEYDSKKTEGIPKIEFIDEILEFNHREEISQYVIGEYAKKVELAKEYFKRGDFFEVVPSHIFSKKCDKMPSQLFEELIKINPSPYGFLINLGNEHLIGASPEMYIRVEGKRIETCPISGTIKRGENSIEDAERIKELLNSKKDESELTMCTDVDRNDKSRICVPGTVNVIGRRQIEMYSHLIHTVDHVEGILEDKYDSLDAFMTHMWAVTVTGAPKKAAIEWIERNEDSNREWYGGAVGKIGFNGNINTGLTLRTIRLKNKIAFVRVGATVLFDSIKEDEEQETIVKAAAMMKVIENQHIKENKEINKEINKEENTKDKVVNVLFIDHEDSFVHTLASYFRKTGCNVETLRHNIARDILMHNQYDLVMLSPGPGMPSDFKLKETIKICIDKKMPIFGVCLGLQGIIEYFGGELAILEYPMHGKQSELCIDKDSQLFKDIESLKVGRYHSLYAFKVPKELKIVAKTKDGIVMAIENQEKSIYAVQFHPESIMSMEDDNGYRIIKNIVDEIRKKLA